MKSLKNRFAQVAQSSLARGLVAVGVGALGFSGAANAATFELDTTSIVTTISAAVTTISAVGMAVLSLVVVIKLFKWMQRVLG
jgi:putative copper export protein